MIPRYTRPAMEAIWNERHEWQTMLDVEIAACEANAQLGRIPKEAVEVIKEKADFDRFFHYLSVVLAFIAGAIVLVFCHHLFGAHSILIVSILFLIMALTQTFHLWQFYHTNRFTI